MRLLCPGAVSPGSSKEDINESNEDDEIPEELGLDESLWDSSLFVFHPLAGHVTSIYVSTLILLQAVMQILVVYLLQVRQ
eukprot:1195786-Prorocentrum_minimum.AAC.4